MSDKTEIRGVTVEHTGGGHYELTHPSLPDPVKVRGKEDAEKRANAIADSLAPDNTPSAPAAPIPGSGGADPAGTQTPPAGPTATAAAVVTEPTAEEKKDAEKVKEQDDEITQLKAQLAEAQAREKELTDAAGNLVTTVNEQQADVDTEGQIPVGVPREYAGQMEAKQKKALEKLGIKTTRIILEEGPEIPPTGLFLAVNGDPYVIKPGEEVDVPDFLLGILDTAIMAGPIVDSANQMKVVGYRNRMRYPYRRV